MQIDNIREYLFYTAITLLVLGMPFSRAFVSIGQVVFGVVFLFDLQLWTKIKNIASNKRLLVFLSFYALMWLGLAYSQNIEYGFFDLRTRLPWLLFAIVFATEKPLPFKTLRFFLILFAITVTASIMFSWVYYLTHQLIDYRDAFFLISHIRLSVQAAIAFSIFFYFSFKDRDLPLRLRIVFVALALVLVGLLLSMELLTGIVLIGVASLLFIFRLFYFRNSSRMVIFVLLVFFGMSMAIGVTIYRAIEEYYTPVNNQMPLVEFTSRGNPYQHQKDAFPIENGNYAGLYVQWDELKEAWNERSSIDFDGTDSDHQLIKYTLLRYLNSMQLRKDAEAVYSLSKQDIANVEAGYANVEYTRRFSLKKRLYKSLWEYELMKRGAASSGHTLIQRIELWNTAIQIIKAQPLLGVGIGDTQDAFQTQFLINNSSLIGSGLRSHNQFLSTIVGFGILGLVVFLLAILYPVINGKTQKNSLLVYFIVFILTSMLWEDTLETLIGVSIFSFFYSLLVFGTSGLTKKPETD